MAPALEPLRLFTKIGNWNRIGPAGACPVSFKVTFLPLTVMLIPRCLPPVIGTFATSMTLPVRTQLSGTPRPTTSSPLLRSATSESSNVRFASAEPQACGDAPAPADGWLPVQGSLVTGAATLSHHEYGPPWVLAIMNW